MKFEIGGIRFDLVSLAELVGGAQIMGSDLLQKLREFGLGRIAGWEHAEVFQSHSSEFPAKWREGKKRLLFWEAGLAELKFFSGEELAYSYSVRSAEGEWILQYRGLGFWGNLDNIFFVAIEGPPRSVCEQVEHCPTLPDMRDWQLVGYDQSKPGVRGMF